MDNLTNTPNFLSTFSALSRFENTKSIQTTVNGKHSIVSAKSAISKSGNPMVAIDFAHVRHDDNGIMDFLQTGRAKDWKHSYDRIKYLMHAMSISPEEIASALTVNGVEITPFTQAWATADGQACAQGTEGAKPVLTANYDKESIDALKEIHGEDLDILSFDEPENFVDYAKAEGLITEGTELKKIGLAVYVDKTRATQFCDAIASLIESKKENAVVYLKVAENKEGYLKIRNYSKPSKA